LRRISMGGRLRQGGVALTTAAALLLTGCSASFGIGDDSAATDEPTASAAEDEAPEIDGGAGSEPPSEPLATIQGSSPFVKLEIADFRRVGDIVTLEFVIVSDGSSSIGPASAETFAAQVDHARALGGEAGTTEFTKRMAVSGVTLVDAANRKRHLVLRDSQGECLCTHFGGETAEDNRYRHSAQFPAPPAEVDRMTVQVPAFPAADNVPLRTAS
jgi:hypothetical protein